MQKEHYEALLNEINAAPEAAPESIAESVEPELEEELQTVEEAVEEAQKEPELEAVSDSEPEKPINPARQRILQREEEAKKALMEKELEIARLKGQNEILQQKPKEPEKTVEVDAEPERDTYEHDQWVARQAIKKAEILEQKIIELEAKAKFAEAEKEWIEFDKEISESDGHYKNSMDFLRKEHRRILKESFPQASQAQIEQQARLEEYATVAKLAAQGFNPKHYFMGLARDNGFDALSTEKPLQAQKKAPDKQEIAFHKKNAGSVVTAPAGEAYTGVTLRDTGRMSLKDLQQVMADPEQFSRLRAEAIRKDMRGEFAF